MGKRNRAGLDDERFSRVKSDPLFSGLKTTDKKVVIDKRFAAALTDEKFSSRTKVDMRGKKQKKTLGNDMLDLYELKETSKDTKTEKKERNGKVSNPEIDDFFDENDAEDEEEENNEDDSDEEEEEEEPQNIYKKLDLARGEGNVESSSDDGSSSDEDDEDDDEEDQNESRKTRESMQLELDLANLDKNADIVEWTSKRLAVCNLDWEHMHCEDILMLVKSFIPENGRAISVGIYMSDFGKEQLESEEKNGPSVRLAKPLEEYGEDELDPDTKAAVREYLLNRLKYYYAVIEFDSEESAQGVYEECDGFQFEETGLKMDMRFIPDDMEFEEDRVREFLKADDVNLKKYKPKKKPKNVISSTSSKVAWDEDDPSRSKKLLQAFEGNDEAGKELIVASDESDDEEKRNNLLSLLNTEETGAKLDIEWSGDDEPNGKSKLVGDGADSDSDGEYVKIDDDAEEIGIKSKMRKNIYDDSDDEKQDEEKSNKDEKLTGYQKFLKNKKAKIAEKKLTKRKGQPAETTIKNATVVENVTKDDRFKALFTDSAFAIEPSSKKFKGSDLAVRQAQHKTDISDKAQERTKSSTQEDLINKLKKKTEKWKSK